MRFAEESCIKAIWNGTDVQLLENMQTATSCRSHTYVVLKVQAGR